MNNRDFDQDDARELAEFAGYEKNKGSWVLPQPDYYEGEGLPSVNEKDWRPWHHRAEQWQIQSLLDAVREKGLEREFLDELTNLLEDDHKYVWDVIPNFEQDYMISSAPPEAICSAILSMEVE